MRVWKYESMGNSQRDGIIEWSFPGLNNLFHSHTPTLPYSHLLPYFVSPYKEKAPHQGEGLFLYRRLLA